jgi:3-methylcrotonyl-CoA carboxylase alpha subunit
VEGERIAFRLDGTVVRARVLMSGESVHVLRDGDCERWRLPPLDLAALAEASGGAEHIVSPMPGQVISVAVSPGDRVAAGQVLLVVEAMKMEHTITAPRAGVVAALCCAAGDRVEDGVELVTLEAPEEAPA